LMIPSHPTSQFNFFQISLAYLHKTVRIIPCVTTLVEASMENSNEL
jgi:hypothetical protein